MLTCRRFWFPSLVVIAVLSPPSAKGVSPASPPRKIEITADARRAAQSSNSFAFDLYSQLRRQDGNLFYSPASISAALAMTYAWWKLW